MTTIERCLVATLLAVALLAGCGGGKEVTRYDYLPKVPAVKAVVLLEPEFYFRKMAPYQVYQKWSDLADQVSRRFGVAVIGPDEFRVMVKGVVTNLAQETDLRTVLDGYGVEPKSAVAIRLNLTESWQQGERAIVGEDGKRQLAAEFDSRFECSADVYHVGTSRPLLSITRYHQYRGAQLPSGSDARPELTEFANSCYAALLDLLASELSMAAPIDHGGIRVVESPGPALKYTLTEMPPLAVKLENLDAIEADALVQSLVNYRLPDAERKVMRAAMASRDGLAVIAGGSCSDVQAGDVINKINNRPVSRWYHLSNEIIRARGAGKPVALQFTRGKDAFQTVLQCGKE